MQKLGSESPHCTVTDEYSVSLTRPTSSSAPIVRGADRGFERRSSPVEATLTSEGKVRATGRGIFVAVSRSSRVPPLVIAHETLLARIRNSCAIGIQSSFYDFAVPEQKRTVTVATEIVNMWTRPAPRPQQFSRGFQRPNALWFEVTQRSCRQTRASRPRRYS